MASEELHALPEDQPGLSGESIEKGKGDRYVINVSNAKGYLCHIHMEVQYPLCWNLIPNWHVASGLSNPAMQLQSVLLQIRILSHCVCLHVIVDFQEARF